MQWASRQLKGKRGRRPPRRLRRTVSASAAHCPRPVHPLGKRRAEPRMWGTPLPASAGPVWRSLRFPDTASAAIRALRSHGILANLPCGPHPAWPFCSLSRQSRAGPRASHRRPRAARTEKRHVVMPRAPPGLTLRQQRRQVRSVTPCPDVIQEPLYREARLERPGLENSAHPSPATPGQVPRPGSREQDGAARAGAEHVGRRWPKGGHAGRGVWAGGLRAPRQLLRAGSLRHPHRHPRGHCGDQTRGTDGPQLTMAQCSTLVLSRDNAVSAPFPRLALCGATLCPRRAAPRRPQAPAVFSSAPCHWAVTPGRTEDVQHCSLDGLLRTGACSRPGATRV